MSDVKAYKQYPTGRNTDVIEAMTARADARGQRGAEHSDKVDFSAARWPPVLILGSLSS